MLASLLAPTTPGLRKSWVVGLTVVLATWLVVASSALAQSTGSSAGGGSWGSSGGSSSGSWHPSGSGSSTDIAPADSYEPPLWGQLVIAAGFLVLLVVVFRALARFAEPPKIGVTRLQLALDGRARRFVQAALADMVAKGETATRSGLSELLSRSAGALRAARLAWVYCSVEQHPPSAAAEAQATHARLALDARSRFQTELVRAADGVTRRAETPALVAREHEGEGVVVVSLIVATPATLGAASPARLDEVEQLLARLAALPASELVALELVWSPAADADRMSTDELETRYPELTRLTAIGGRVFCGHCGGPHTAELAKCPHCGAPVPAEPAQA